MLVGLLTLCGCAAEPATDRAASNGTKMDPTLGSDPETVEIPSGSFERGPGRHHVTVSAFTLDRTEVTVGAFREFVEATGFVTEAERWGWSLVFQPERTSDPESEQRVPGTPWWLRVDGAQWRTPHADGQSAPEDHPVVHVSWNDARSFCEWRGARLPTEAEWEFASLGAGAALYPWGEDLRPEGEWRGNTWQGRFPEADHQDGHPGLAPVASFPANAYGVHDLGGNVWEWVDDWYDPSYFERAPERDPPGPDSGTEKVLRGGSWLCSESYCQGYRRDRRNASPRDSGLDNTGFRCARDAGR